MTKIGNVGRSQHRNRVSMIRSSLALILLILSAAAGSASAAVLEVEEVQGVVGQALSISGNGFGANETVKLDLTVGYDTSVVHAVYRLPDVTTDDIGDFHLQWTVPPELRGLPLFQLFAIGLNSGFFAEAVLMTGNTTLEIDVSPDDVICLATITPDKEIQVCAGLYQICNGGEQVPLAGKQITFYVNNTACGVSAGHALFGAAVTDSTGTACATITRLDTLELTDEISFRVKFAGESKPDSTQPPNSACDPEERVTLAVANNCQALPVINDCSDVPEIEFGVSAIDTADLYFVRSIDLDRDNLVDVVYTGSVTEGLFVAYGNNSGGLETPVNYLTISQDAFDFGYLNADTLLDIIAVQGSNTYLLYNEGNRMFNVDSVQGVTRSHGSPNALAANVPAAVSGYFNADPYLDVVRTPDLLLLGQAGGMSFTEVLLPFNIDAVEPCDFDNSGSEDLVVLNEDSMFIYVNDGAGNFSYASAVHVGLSSFEVPPIIVITDFDTDGNCDYAVVLPTPDTTEQSVITVMLGDGAGNAAEVQTLTIDGIAYNLSANDVDRDHILDIIVANGSTGALQVFYGDGTGHFEEPQTIDLGAGVSQTYALGALDVDRDGNIDFVSGELGGGDLVLAVSQEPDDPVLPDEMIVFGFSNLNVKVQNPDGDIISPTTRTVAGSDYQTVDINEDGLLDERTLDYNLQYGEYIVTVALEPDAPEGPGGTEPTYGAAIGIDGSQQAVLYSNYNNAGVAKNAADTILQADSLTFYYTVEPVSSIQPPNGYPVSLSRPTFDWTLQRPDDLPEYVHHFQLDRFFDFRAPTFDTAQLAAPIYRPDASLGTDSVYYWRYRVHDGTEWSEWSRTFAVFTSNLCCLYSAGNADSDPDGIVDVSDAAYLVGFLFAGLPQPGTHPGCTGAGNADGEGIINVADVSYIVDYLFKDGPEPAPCP